MIYLKTNQINGFVESNFENIEYQNNESNITSKNQENITQNSVTQFGKWSIGIISATVTVYLLYLFFHKKTPKNIKEIQTIPHKKKQEKSISSLQIVTNQTKPQIIKPNNEIQMPKKTEATTQDASTQDKTPEIEKSTSIKYYNIETLKSTLEKIQKAQSVTIDSFDQSIFEIKVHKRQEVENLKNLLSFENFEVPADWINSIRYYMANSPQLILLRFINPHTQYPNTIVGINLLDMVNTLLAYMKSDTGFSLWFPNACYGAVSNMNAKLMTAIGGKCKSNFPCDGCQTILIIKNGRTTPIKIHNRNMSIPIWEFEGDEGEPIDVIVSFQTNPYPKFNDIFILDESSGKVSMKQQIIDEILKFNYEKCYSKTTQRIRSYKLLTKELQFMEI